MCLCTGNRGDGSSNAARLGASHPLPDLTGASSTLQRLIQSLHAEVVDELSKPIPQRQEVKERKPDGAGDEHAGLCARFTTRRKGSRFGRSVAYSASDLSEHSSMALLVAHEISHQWHVAIESDSKLRGKQRLAAPETDLGQGTQVAIAMASPMPRDATRPPVLTFGDGVMSVLTAAHWHAIRRRMLPMLLLTLAAAVTFDSHDQPTVIILEHGNTDGPLRRGALRAVKDLQLGGAAWRNAERKASLGAFAWVYDAKASTPLHRHSGRAPLLVVSKHHESESFFTLIAKGSDFRNAFAFGSEQRAAIARWEAGVLSRDLLGVKMLKPDAYYPNRPPAGRTFAECLRAFDVAHNKRHGTYHMFWSVHAHGGCGQTYTVAVEGDDTRDYQARIPYVHFDEGAGSAGWDLWRSLVEPFAHFATEIYKRTWPLEQQCWAQEAGRVHHDHPWSYFSFSCYSDLWHGKSVSESLHGSLSGEPNLTADGSSAGLDLHEDEENKSATVVLVFGIDLEGFDQIYPTTGVRIACNCWAFACADASELLHAVAHGRGFRIALVYATHATMADGHDHKGKRVLWPERRLARNGVRHKEVIGLPPSAGWGGCPCAFCGVKAFEAREASHDVTAAEKELLEAAEEPLHTRASHGQSKRRAEALETAEMPSEYARPRTRSDRH